MSATDAGITNLVVRSIRRLWDRPLTWKLSILLGGTFVGLLGLTLLVPEDVGTPAAWVLLLAGIIVIARTAENDLRNRAQAEPAWDRRWSPGRSLLYPWWARGITVATAAFGGGLLAKATSSEWLAWFLAVMLIGVLIEWVVVRTRTRRRRLT
jgi:hypothetical protein